MIPIEDLFSFACIGLVLGFGISAGTFITTLLSGERTRQKQRDCLDRERLQVAKQSLEWQMASARKLDSVIAKSTAKSIGSEL
jgi:hypothetical protein